MLAFVLLNFLCGILCNSPSIEAVVTGSIFLEDYVTLGFRVVMLQHCYLYTWGLGYRLDF